jgi:hypothetical protein
MRQKYYIYHTTKTCDYRDEVPCFYHLASALFTVEEITLDTYWRENWIEPST